MNKRIDAMLAHVASRGIFPGITRYAYQIQNVNDERKQTK